MLKSLDNPNIIKFYEIYSDENAYHIVMEWAGGGEMIEKVLSYTNYTEENAANIM